MAHTSEIEKLEQRWRDNPQSRHFAPLADAYRKTGQFDRAIEVLSVGLEQHPAYASAHIVLGRTRMDMGQPAEAEAAFRRVLELDGENVIAIRALAEISEADNRLEEAEHWLNYLLSIDAGNEDAREQLGNVTVRRSRQAAVPEVPPEDEPAAEAEAPVAEDEAPVEGGEPSVEDEGVAEPVALEEVQEAETMQFVASSGEEAGEIEPEEALPIESAADQLVPEPIDLQEEPEEPAIDHWADSPESPEAPAPPFELGVERQEDIVLRPLGSSEFQAPDASQDLAPTAGPDATGETPEAGEAPAPPAPPALPAWASEERWGEDQWASLREPPGPAASEPPGSMEPADAFAGEPWEDGSPEAGMWTSLSEPGAVVGTDAEAVEEMAAPESGPDLAAAAGPRASRAEPTSPETPPERTMLSESAALQKIEEAPLAPPPPRPEPESGGRRHLEDERAAAGAPLTEPELVVTQSMGDVYAAQGHRREALQVYRRLLERTPGDAALRRKIDALSEPAVPPPAPVAHAARETGGQSVRDYFHALLTQASSGGAEPAESAAPEGPGSSTPDEAFAGEQGMSGAPTRPAAEPISLSDIFGEDSSPVPPVMPSGEEEEEEGTRSGLSFDEFFGDTPPPRPEGRPRPRAARLSQAEQDDLEQFHNWLKGLKR